MTPSRPDPHPCPTLIFDGGRPVLTPITRYLIAMCDREFIVYAAPGEEVLAKFASSPIGRTMRGPAVVTALKPLTESP